MSRQFYVNFNNFSQIWLLLKNIILVKIIRPSPHGEQGVHVLYMYLAIGRYNLFIFSIYTCRKLRDKATKMAEASCLFVEKGNTVFCFTCFSTPFDLVFTLFIWIKYLYIISMSNVSGIPLSYFVGILYEISFINQIIVY